VEFKKYQHVERFGNEEVEGIENGTCYIFYKIDGTNGSIWHNGIEIKAGSRNREIDPSSDNQGFFNSGITPFYGKYESFFKKYPELRLYGEWLVPHSLKTYSETAWKKFYIFDVMSDDNYIPYESYVDKLKEFNIDFIPPIAIMENTNYESLLKLLDKTGEFLIKDGCGNGEGIVIKNYDFVNKYGRTTWAKIVSNEFKEKHKKEMGAPIVRSVEIVEQNIIDDLLTEEFVRKEYEKIKENGWSSKNIPELLSRVFYEFIKDEHWNIIKKYKYPTVNHKRLNQLCILKTKEFMSELF
jgi:hypothetical protein